MITQHLIYYLILVLQIYQYIMVFSVFLTWLPSLYEYKFFRVIDRIGGGYLKYFRGYLVIGVLDFTPIIGFILYGQILKILPFLL